MRWPTLEGIARPSIEVELTETRLDINNERSFNTHHTEWRSRRFGEFLITQTLRDLEGQQDTLPRDVHQKLHDRYEPPLFPTPKQAMSRIALAYSSGEDMRIFDQMKRRYVQVPLTDTHMQLLDDEYNKLSRRGDWR